MCSLYGVASAVFHSLCQTSPRRQNYILFGRRVSEVAAYSFLIINNEVITTYIFRLLVHYFMFLFSL